jgi:hypothetical protein
MQDPDFQKQPANRTSGVSGFFVSLLDGILRSMAKLVIIFALGTLGGAAICLYHGYPLIYSFIGGIAIFAIAAAVVISS